MDCLDVLDLCSFLACRGWHWHHCVRVNHSAFFLSFLFFVRSRRLPRRLGTRVCGTDAH